MKSGTALWIGLFLVAILGTIGCSSSSEPKNQNPTLPEVSPANFQILPSGRVLLTASATDPDGDHVTFFWSFTGGAPGTAEGDTVTWTAPASGSVTITTKARDGRGGERVTTSVATVNVGAAYPYGSPFEGTLEPALGDLEETGSRGFCHFNASVMVEWTTATVLVFTGLPTVAFLEALTWTPVWIPPATWVWSYSVPWGTSRAIVELQTVLNQQARLDWQMLVSGTILGFDRFQWVTGQTSLTATDGSWMLYDYRYPTQVTEALRIEFARASETDRDVDYFNALQSSSSYGDSLSYARHGAAAEVKLCRVSQSQPCIRAAWDTFDGSGRYYGVSGDSCCWGPRPTFIDVACP